MDEELPTDLTGATASAEKAAASLTLLNGAAENAGNSLKDLSKVGDLAKEVYGSFTLAADNLGISLNHVGSLSDENTAKMALLSTAVFGTRKAFDGLAGVDTGNMRTVKDQFSELAMTISNSPILSELEKVKKLTGVFQTLGFPMEKVNDAAKKGSKAMTSLGGSFFEAVDNGLRLQNVIVQLASKNGELNKVYEQAGNDLGNMNSIIATHNAMIADTVKGTGLNERQVESYYAALGSVPGALMQNISGLNMYSEGSTKANVATSMLTATIQLAAGSGRKYDDIIGDLHTSFRDYGMRGEDALKFTARFSEISNTFGVQLEDVRTHLMGAAGAFKTFADAGQSAGRMSESLSGIMNDYMDGLTGTGMSGEHAASVVRGMTDSMAGLSVAQKAFLSAQTGGPGGLMGAFQIEKMMKEGKMDEVFAKVKNTMEKQLGPIVTLNEASSSPAAASQLQKQMLMLQRGPLGGMVKSDQDAYRLLEVFKGKQDGKIIKDMGAEGLKQDNLSEIIGRGNSFQEKSYTALASANSILAEIRRLADSIALSLMQKAGTASTGSGDFLGNDTVDQTKMRTNLKESKLDVISKSANKPGGIEANEVAAASINSGRSFVENLLSGENGIFGSVTDTFKSVFESAPAPVTDPSSLINEVSSGQVVFKENKAKETAKIEKKDSENNGMDVVVQKNSTIGKYKVLVDVKVVEDGGQAKAITPVSN